MLFILIGLLGVVVYQDFKSRSISWFLIPLLFVGFVANALLKIEPNELITYLGINFLLVLLNLIGVTLLLSIKEKKWVNIIDNYLGLGDVLFFVVITVAFSPFNFVAFYLGSVLLITLIYGSVILINKKRNTLIPLAGAMSLLLVGFMFMEQFTSLQLYQDFVISGFILGSY